MCHDHMGRVKSWVGSQPLCLSFPIRKQVGLWWGRREACRNHLREQRQHQPQPHGVPCQWDVRGLPSSAPTPATPAVPGLPPGRAQILDENGLLMTLPELLGPGCPCSTSQWRLSRKKGNSSRPCGWSRGLRRAHPHLLPGQRQGGRSDPPRVHRRVRSARLRGDTRPCGRSPECTGATGIHWDTGHARVEHPLGRVPQCSRGRGLCTPQRVSGHARTGQASGLMRAQSTCEP